MSPGDVVANIVFKIDEWAPPTKAVREVTFTGVAFPKSIGQATFTDCSFEDCLFLGTRFIEVEFHGCSFTNSNFWKSRFERVYLDPDSILMEARFKVEASNAGISVYQALLSNFAEERQDEFYIKADISFRRWKRYQIWPDLRRKRLTRTKAWTRWLGSVVYEILAGFGYRPFRFFLWTIALFLLVSWINYKIIGQGLIVNGSILPLPSFTDTMFYTFSVLTVLGFSSVLPIDGFSKILTVFEALAAIGWLGIFTSVLVKRFLR
ncbi:pentapeptide repeat-containing protein [Mesorhizobium sp. ES1-1]|uniref:pentapeptide repeat-containing protein n=1 Tax=Mesorhizobium sp. ES1-1 TaxID=2876629 RepID=UPI001CCC8906|nr:pentapeptide repeat-containing protein [Mesorhizobium sp. ES1-1]MBZ9675242.1 pentapeptide repeat-containing protein [Mesorhizobium sp. ES1-1]